MNEKFQNEIYAAITDGTDARDFIAEFGEIETHYGHYYAPGEGWDGFPYTVEIFADQSATLTDDGGTYHHDDIALLLVEHRNDGVVYDLKLDGESE